MTIGHSDGGKQLTFSAEYGKYTRLKEPAHTPNRNIKILIKM